MSFAQKSQENLEIAEYYISKSKNVSAIVGNAYYAVFQKAKDFLVANQFDYSLFLKSNNFKPDERPFSHGTIRQAVQYCVVTQKGGDLGTIKELAKMDKLYAERRRAHYEADIVKNKDGETCVLYAKNIITTIDSFVKP